MPISHGRATPFQAGVNEWIDTTTGVEPGPLIRSMVALTAFRYGRQ